MDSLIPWTDKERRVLDGLTTKMEMSEHQVLKMSLKWLQIIELMRDEGYTVVRFQTRDGEMRPIGPPPPGCMGE